VITIAHKTANLDLEEGMVYRSMIKEKKAIISASVMPSHFNMLTYVREKTSAVDILYATTSEDNLRG